MLVRRIFHKDGFQVEQVDDIPTKEPKECALIVIYKGIPFEFVMYDTDTPPIDWKFMYVPLKERHYESYDSSDVEVISFEEEVECDCGGKHVSGTHAHYCSTQQKVFS